MHKILCAVLLAALITLLPGCGVRRSSEHSVPTATPKANRTDLLGNPITTEYAPSTFLRTEGDTLFVTADDETEASYVLSERAKKDISSLGISEGTRIIINFTTLESGEKQADSLEKILAE